MSLVDKLRRIAARATAPAPATPPVQGATGGAGLPGGLVEGDEGAYWMRSVRLPVRHEHGRVPLGAAASVEGLAPLAPEAGSVDLRRAVFFDTETTSLGGGVGTYVFLLGAGWFSGDDFVVEQYFLRDVTQERALLHAICRRLQGFSLLVSFHGKGFDAPRLLDRLAFHRMSPALPETHLDLCLVGRSLYRGAFSDCRLQTFEKELVGFARADDLPGAECPQAFFDHLRGDSRLMPRVFEHNLHDVLTLPAVAACFAREASSPTHPVVLANLGLVHEGAGRDREARDAYRAALPGLRAERHPLLARTLERLALLERRAGRHAASGALLLERSATFPHALQPLEDLAKYYEHRARDYRRAEETALDAYSRIVTGRIPLDAARRVRSLRSLDHRIARLRRRMHRGSLS